MKHVDFDPVRLAGEQAAWWAKWQQRADEATLEAIDAWEDGKEPKFKEAIWKDLKEWLLANIFNDKCAYCETRAVRDPGHAEHFRPKGRVDVRDPVSGKWVPASVEWPDGTVAPHPGYFWLAYHWKNLLPACHYCNSGRGKQNQFPLSSARKHALIPRLTGAEAAKIAAKARASVKWKQRYYLDPDELDALESPEILNPYVDDPRKYLRFGEGGIVTAIDDNEKGKESIRVFQLDDDKLREDRQRAQTKAAMTFKSALGIGLIQTPPAVALENAFGTLTDFRSGREEYSTAALDYVDLLVQQIRAAFLGGGK